MYFFEIKFTPSDRPLNSIDMFRSQFSYNFITEYLDSLCMNGQIQEDYTVVDSDGVAIAYVNCPEKKSLILKNNSKLTKGILRRVKKFYDVEHKILGQNLTYGEDYCECNNPSFYMLRGDVKDDNSPIVCGDCEQPVPLYKLPCDNDELLHAELLAWHKAYITFMDMITEDVYPVNEIEREFANPRSNISKWGIEYCNSLEKLIEKTVYYYLYNPKEKAPKKCPVCGKMWKYIAAKDDEEKEAEVETPEEKSSILRANFGAEYDWCACDKCKIIMDI